MLFECMGICVLSPAHELPCLCANRKKNYLIDFVYSLQPQYVRLDGLREILWGFFETFLEGSVDHIIYRDYIVNRRFFYLL